MGMILDMVMGVVDMDVDKVADMELDFTDTQLWQLVILEMMLAVMLGVVDMESEWVDRFTYWAVLRFCLNS